MTESPTIQLIELRYKTQQIIDTLPPEQRVGFNEKMDAIDQETNTARAAISKSLQHWQVPYGAIGWQHLVQENVFEEISQRMLPKYQEVRKELDEFLQSI